MITIVQSAEDKSIHDLVVDVLADLMETAQLKEAAAGDTSNMFMGCQLGVYEHTKVTYTV